MITIKQGKDEMIAIEKDGQLVWKGAPWDMPDSVPGIRNLLTKLGLTVEVNGVRYGHEPAKPVSLQGV
jgi:hypothetical protein